MKLSAAQTGMLLESEPSDLDPFDGCGVELRTGADYAIAKALERRGLGHVQGPGGSLPGMYWSNADGLAARREFLGIEWTDDDDDARESGE